jgi:NurA-like 5'-3' nuclease
MVEMLIEKVHQRTVLYDTKSPDYREQHMRANAWEGMGKELKVKRNFYVSSRDVRMVCPRLKTADRDVTISVDATTVHLVKNDRRQITKIKIRHRQ